MLTPLPCSYAAGPSLGLRLRDALEVALLVFVLYLLFNTVTGRYRVLSISMEPTLHEGDHVLINKVHYWLHPVRRGDIVVFYSPHQPEKSTPLIKRVVGLPGERVEARAGRLWIDGTPLNEPYVSGPMSYEKTWIVDERTYVVLGDNRNNSNDSHCWGTLPHRAMIGKAVFRYWPPERFGELVPYEYPKLEVLP
ncbi:MAG: signal peptidase I [Anaerolineae bacterium]